MIVLTKKYFLDLMMFFVNYNINKRPYIEYNK